MKKFSIKAIILFTICILLLTIYNIKMHYPINSAQATLIKCFSNSGARFVSSEFYAWGKVNGKYENLEDLKLLAQEFLHDLGVEDERTISWNVADSDYMQRLELDGRIGENSKVKLNIQLNEATATNKSRIITVSVTDDLDSSNLERIAEMVVKTFRRHNVKPIVNTCIIGNFDGKLDYNRLNEIALGILREARAKKVDNMRDGNYISVSAYSPNINTSMKVNGKDVNLNLAIRYNSYEKKTYIWLATPVITTEY